jgi:hypothetical protein
MISLHHFLYNNHNKYGKDMRHPPRFKYNAKLIIINHFWALGIFLFRQLTANASIPKPHETDNISPAHIPNPNSNHLNMKLSHRPKVTSDGILLYGAQFLKNIAQANCKFILAKPSSIHS